MQRGEQQFFKDRVFTKLFDAAEIAKFDKAEYKAYEESLKALRTGKTSLKRRRRKQGRKDVRTYGRSYGKNIRDGSSNEIRRRTLDVIAQCSGLSEEEINQLEEQEE